MSTRRFTPIQRAVLDALSRTQWKSNAQIAEAADTSESYASRVLSLLSRLRDPQTNRPYAVSAGLVQDAEDPTTHYRLWKRG